MLRDDWKIDKMSLAEPNMAIRYQEVRVKYRDENYLQHEEEAAMINYFLNSRKRIVSSNFSGSCKIAQRLNELIPPSKNGVKKTMKELIAESMREN